MRLEPIADKWQSFGWKVVELLDGHNHHELEKAFRVSHEGHPKCIIANTVKGKGISYMENNLKWHYQSPQGEGYRQAIMELEAQKHEKRCN